MSAGPQCFQPAWFDWRSFAAQKNATNYDEGSLATKAAERLTSHASPLFYQPRIAAAGFGEAATHLHP
jgi:hypothetical protein